MIHPNDRTLEQYRRRNLTPEQMLRVNRHMKSCPRCVSRLQAFADLESRLADVQLEEPAPGFTESVLKRLAASAAETQPEADGLSGESPSSPERRRRYLFRPELANAIVATAATYVFVSSGFVKAILAFDGGAAEYQLYSKVQVVVEWMGELSKALH